MKGLVKRLVYAVTVMLALVAGATTSAIIVSQTSWFKNWLRVYLVREASQYLNGTLSIDRLGGNLFFGLEMANVAVFMDGTQVVAVKDVGLDYSVFELISRGLSVHRIRLDKPVIHVTREGDGWSIGGLIKKQEQEATRRGPRRPVSIDEIGISDGSVVVGGGSGTPGVELPRRFEQLNAKLAFKYEPVRYSIDIDHLSFRGSDPPIALNALSGGVSVRGETLYLHRVAIRTAETSLSVEGAVQHYLTKPVVNLQIGSDRTSLPEIAHLVPALGGVALQAAYELQLNGPLDRLDIEMNIRSPGGRVTGSVVADLLTSQQSVAGNVSIHNFDLSPILKDPRQKSDITANAQVAIQAAPFSDVHSLRGIVSVTAPRIVAAGFDVQRVKMNARVIGRDIAIDGRGVTYGATVTAAGRIRFPAKSTDAVAMDLRGHAQQVDLSRLPHHLTIPPASSRINAAYYITGTPANLTGNAIFDQSVVAGATVAAGGTAAFTVQGNEFGYQAEATLAHLDLQRFGDEFRVPGLAEARYKTSINGYVTARGHVTPQQPIDVSASGTLTNTSIAGGRIRELAFDFEKRQDTAHLKASGSFAGFDPAFASGRPFLRGTVDGVFDGDVTISEVSKGFTPDNVQATGVINLEPSTVGGLEIGWATIAGDYRESTAEIRLLEIVGHDLNARATGRLALNDTAQSNLIVHADSPDLAQIGKLVNQPLAGIGRVDATITGNRRELQATGTVAGNGVRYASHSALAISSAFTAQVPELDAASATVSATTHGTFVTVGGENINDVTAKIDYAARCMAFDATAKEPERTLNATGSLAMLPKLQEVRLQALSLTTQGMTWHTTSGSVATIRYADAAEVTVENLSLVNGNQQIVVDGTLGDAGNSLRVKLDNVDAGAIDALLLRPPQLSGRLNASASITSDWRSESKRAPQVKADFTIDKGAFRRFRYDSFGGTADYTGDGVVLDAKLQQSPTAWIDVKGQVPIALFNSTASSSNDPIDLHVDSSPIDLGLVQGFTTALTNVTGTLEAHVRVTGSASDPRPEGAVTVQKGAFTLEPTSVAYTGLDGTIELHQDRIRIQQIRVLDDHRKPMTVAGDIAVHELEIGDVSIAVKADDFKVIDNKMGHVRVNSDLKLTGDVKAPRLEGFLDVSTGAINLDPILNLIGASAYATKQTEYPTSRGEVPGNSQAPSPGGFDTAQIDVHLRVPNDLLIKASDLRRPGASISLGALNVTLGGDVYVSKVPYDQTRLYGIVNTVRGAYDFQGRRFEILRDGGVRFEGLDDLDPTLDLRTERVIQAVTASVNVRGTLRKPEIVLSSTPPMEQADILSLIVFNQPINQVGEGQQIALAQRAQALATGAVVSELANSIGNALNINLFEISTAPTSGATAELTFGQNIGQNLFVKVQQGIGEQSQTNFVLEYELAKWLRLQTNVVQGSSTQPQLFKRRQGSGVDLLFSFKY